MLSQIFNSQLIAEAFGTGGTLLILAGIGYMFTDRAGVFNIAIEGLLLFAAFFAAVASGALSNALAGVVAMALRRAGPLIGRYDGGTDHEGLLLGSDGRGHQVAVSERELSAHGIREFCNAKTIWMA